MTSAFSDDPAAQLHARAWAENQWRDNGDLFVAWLLTLSDEDQQRIYCLGYRAAEREFEETFPEVK